MSPFQFIYKLFGDSYAWPLVEKWLVRSLVVFYPIYVYVGFKTMHCCRLYWNGSLPELLILERCCCCCCYCCQFAIIEYDPGTCDIKTRSLHFFEDEEIKVCWLYQRFLYCTLQFSKYIMSRVWTFCILFLPSCPKKKKKKKKKDLFPYIL